jgi:hypothetical protein
MLAREFRGFLDVVEGEDFTCKIRLQYILQPGHFGVIEKAAARANVRIYMSRIGRVLPPMAEFVAVGVQDRIQSEWLDGGLLFRVQAPCLSAALVVLASLTVHSFAVIEVAPR